jgi:hypothetical protein
MDKLAPAIAWIKANKFWLGNGILFLAMIGVWYYGTGDLTSRQQDRERQIKSDFSTAKNIQAVSPDDIDGEQLHPNASTVTGMKAELERTANSIVAGWEHRVKAQQDLLVFPKVIGTERFHDIFAKYNPPETFPPNEGAEVDALLGLYRINIQKHMINICGDEGVRTNWLLDPDNYEQEDQKSKAGGRRGGFDDFEMGGMDEMGGMGSGQAEDEDGSRFAVLWSETNQLLWQQKLTTFQGRDDHSKESVNPTALQCYMLQQDLWLLEAMFKIIRELNGDSRSTDVSSIKQIDHIAIGQEAQGKLGQLHPVDKRLGPSAAAAEEEEFGGGMGEGIDEFGMGGMGGMGGTGDSNEIVFDENSSGAGMDEFGMGGEFGMGDDMGMDGGMGMGSDQKHPPFHNRYVDTNFEAIAAEKVLAVVNGIELPEENLELLIAKRVPVRIALRMDERRIGDFMAACSNSPFTFEIQQVRINRHISGGEPIPLGGADATSSGLMGGRGMGGMDGIGDDSSRDFDEVSGVETRTDFNVNVEFFGIVKIYNPVREDLLRAAIGLEPIDEETPAAVEAADAAANDPRRDNS